MNDTTKEINNKLSIKNDFTFNCVFTKPANEDVFISFLESVFNFKAKKIEVLSDVPISASEKEYKQNVLDLKVTLDDNTYVFIEIQMLNNPDTPAFTRFDFPENLSIDSIFNILDNSNKVYTLFICDCDYTQYKGYISHYILTEENHREYIFDERIENIFIELSKFRKEKDLDYNDPLVQWLLFIDGEDKKGVEFAINNNEKIKKAYLTLEALAKDIKLE